MDLELWKKRKKELHLTHDELAEISGISRRTIAGIFGGDPKYASPTFNTVQAIEKALGIDEKKEPSPTQERSYHEKLIEKLDDKQLEKLYAYLQGLIDGKN